MEWKISDAPVAYPDAMAWMQARVKSVQEGVAEECIWLLEHPPLYTAGSSAKSEDLLQAEGFSVYETGRGGQYTYHGPGQRVAYLVLDLNKRGRDLRAYVQQLEQWVIDALASFGVQGFLREGRVGVWVEGPRGEAKIAALGVRAQKWVVSHGIAINVQPNLAHYSGIVPCGIQEFGVTSLADMGIAASLQDMDAALRRTCPFTA